jgi:hypothetical protein
LLYSSPAGDTALSRKDNGSDSQFTACRKMPAERRHHGPL